MEWGIASFADGASQELGSVGHILVLHRQLRSQQGTGVPNSSIDWLRLAGVPHLKWQIVADGKAP